MITISLCMIVKDEEKVLKRCLDSAVSFADEIIIVDTGSSDSTKKIAETYTKKSMISPGTMIFQLPETRRFATRKWITACGWMQTISFLSLSRKKYGG